MKFKILSIPESVKLVTLTSIRPDYRTHFSDSYPFVNFVERQLNKIKKFEVEKEYVLKVSEKEDDAVLRFARFCLQLHRDPLTGVCGYEKILRSIKKEGEKSLSEIFNVKKELKNELFTFIGNEPKGMKMVTFVISGTNYNDREIKLLCVSSQYHKPKN